MHTNPNPKLLFVVNSAAGKNTTDWEAVIGAYFKDKPFTLSYYHLQKNCVKEELKKAIEQHRPDQVIAVGGDGTLKLVTECVLNSNIAVGLIPGGSANGMAKELNIPTDATKALDVLVQGHKKKIDLIRINNELCIHLSDIGFNAFVVKTFEQMNKRGMMSYVKAAFKVLGRHRHMVVTIAGENQTIRREAVMVVFANATRYGTGAVINPEGKLNDGKFELVVIKKIAFGEIIKMMITHRDYDPRKTEVFRTANVQLKSKHHVHFQVDGEYLGKVHMVQAESLPGVLNMIVPKEE